MSITMIILLIIRCWVTSVIESYVPCDFHRCMHCPLMAKTSKKTVKLGEIYYVSRSVPGEWRCNHTVYSRVLKYQRRLYPARKSQCKFKTHFPSELWKSIIHYILQIRSLHLYVNIVYVSICLGMKVPTIQIPAEADMYVDIIAATGSQLFYICERIIISENSQIYRASVSVWWFLL